MSTFYGQDIDFLDCESLALSIPKEMLAAEVELYSTKWFDYRDYHPVYATYLFAHHYENVYRRKYAEIRDLAMSTEISPLRAEELFKSPELNSVWNARQAADRIGVTYEFYIGHAMNKCLANGHKFIPRPSQLYTEQMVDDVKEAWEEYCKNTLQIIQEQSQIGTEHTQDWYIAQLKKRPSPEYAASRLLALGLVSFERLVTNFSEAMANKALRLNSL